MTFVHGTTFENKLELSGYILFIESLSSAMVEEISNNKNNSHEKETRASCAAASTINKSAQLLSTDTANALSLNAFVMPSRIAPMDIPVDDESLHPDDLLFSVGSLSPSKRKQNNRIVCPY